MRRRNLLTGAFAAFGALWLEGCTRLSQSPSFQEFLMGAEGLNRRAQRLLQDRMGLAQEFAPKDIAKAFRANGTQRIARTDYRLMLDGGFADFRLALDGLVERPLSLSLAQLRSLPARTQITRHDCVEGWSSIGEWTGTPLKLLLDQAGLKPRARFIVFHCLDLWDEAGGKQVPYYESIDLYDAHHPQTIIAYDMNGAPLPERHGAPLRLRVERHLGYKHAKFVSRIEAVDRLDNLGGGKGGYWEDRGYEWYAGI